MYHSPTIAACAHVDISSEKQIQNGSHDWSRRALPAKPSRIKATAAGMWSDQEVAGPQSVSPLVNLFVATRLKYNTRNQMDG